MELIEGSQSQFSVFLFSLEFPFLAVQILIQLQEKCFLRGFQEFLTCNDFEKNGKLY